MRKIYGFLKTLLYKIKSLPKKSLALILAVLLLVSAINISFVYANDPFEYAVNYPALNEFNEGTMPSSDGDWSYAVRDFGKKGDLQISTNNFAAPVAQWFVDDAYAQISWNTVDEADQYILNIYYDAVTIHSVTINTNQWKSPSNLIFEGGKTYELQVLAIKNGEQIAASMVRAFKTSHIPNVKECIISDFSSNYDISSDNFNRGTFLNPSIVNNKLVIQTNNTKTYSRIYVKREGMRLANAKAVAFYIKPDSEMIQSFKVGFGDSRSTLQYGISGNSGEIYYISAANPYNMVTSSWEPPTNGKLEVATSALETGYASYCDGGYYVIIPLSIYSDDIRTGISNGTYNWCDILVQSLKYKDSATGEFGGDGKFDGTNITFDDICLIDDIDLFLKELKKEYEKVNNPDKYQEILDTENGASYPFELPIDGEDAVKFADSFSNNEFINTASGTGYKLFNSASAKRIVFSATDKISFNYGAHLRFTAPEDAIYDIGGALQVLNNADVTAATVNYRLVKIDNSKKQTVITGEGEWLQITVDSENMNPKADFPVNQIELKAGESVAIELYQVSVEEDTILNVSLGNPTATVVTVEKTYSGTSSTYKYADYSYNRVFGTDATNVGAYSPIDNRWNAFVIEKNDSEVTYIPFDTVKWKLLHNNSVGTTGYYYESGKVQISKANTGIAFEFIMPYTAEAVINLPLKKSSEEMYVRILKNGEAFYPQNSVWETLPKEASVIKTICNAEKDDIIAIEIYGGNDTATCVIDATPSIIFADQKDANNPTDSVFSPLWERPYRNTEYIGECKIPEGSIWSYEILKIEDDKVKETIPVDYYNSTKKILYKNGSEKCGYIFESDNLKFAFDDSNCGMSLVFNVPSRGYYDISSGFSVLKGAKAVKVRVLKNNQKVWPLENEWQELSKSEDFNALEIGANAGDKLKIEACITTDLKTEKDAVITLETPVIQRLTNRVYTVDGNVTIYNPKDYISFEKNYNGKFNQLNSRFTYFINDKAPIKSISSEQKLLLDDKNYFTFNSSGKIVVMTPVSNVAKINYTSIMDGNGTLSFEMLEVATVRVLKNNEIISDWAEIKTYSKEVSLSAKDVITVEFKGTGNLITVDFINITLRGMHNNTNSAEDDGFYAAYADPYPDRYYSDSYDGKYVKQDNEYWNFDFYSVEDDKILSANAYSTTENHKIYYDKFSNTGYYFNGTMLSADLNAKEGYGIALGFTAPRTDVFNSRYGLRLVTETEGVTIKTRVIKISAQDSNSVQVWPNKDWNEKTVSTGQDITIPYAELSLEVGDKVYLEVYAVCDLLDKITINLVSPAFLKENVININHSDIKAKLYNAHDFGPYKYVENYNGAYIPMDNRWNFHFTEVSSKDEISTVFDADSIRTDTNNEHSFYSSFNNVPQFIWNTVSKMITVRSYVTTDNNVGSVMDFVSPYDGTMSLTAAPTLGNIEVEGASLNYRIIKKNISDNSTSVVWPNVEGMEWETLNNKKTQSECMDIELDVKLGDVLEFQYYWSVDSAKLAEYIASKGEICWKPTFTVTPSITAIEWVNTDRVGFDAVTQFLPEYLVSPYWKVQYSLDTNNIDWKYATLYKGIYWKSNTHNNLGISKNSLYAIENINNSLDGCNPILAWLFTSKSEGLLKMSATKVISLAQTSTDGYNAFIRITVNDDQVYPDAGWTEIKKGDKLKLKDVSFEVKVGDKIRFEVKSSKPIANEDMVRLAWTPAFSISNEVSIYSETDDVFNMLDEQMYAIFKAMDGSTQFDMDLEANKLLSDQKKDWINSVKPFDYSQSEESTESEFDETIDEDVSADDEGQTEQSQTDTGRWKKKIRYIKTAWWVYAIIIAGSVIAVGGALTAAIIIVKKKKFKKLPKSNNK